MSISIVPKKPLCFRQEEIFIHMGFVKYHKPSVILKVTGEWLSSIFTCSSFERWYRRITFEYSYFIWYLGKNSASLSPFEPSWNRFEPPWIPFEPTSALKANTWGGPFLPSQFSCPNTMFGIKCGYTSSFTIIYFRLRQTESSMRN